ncbi:MAG: branched-chain amino acid ABC transporter permease, partial [Betaproteobacteria bacterium]|nr:branched-chain amino acid ABC transporter permease [Betaproteobacteria bacterium]
MDYLFHILVSVALFSILATSFNLLIGYSGLFALSHAAFFGVGAYATAILTTQLGLGFPSPLLIGMLITAFVGIAIALPALRIGGDYLVIVSLALQMIVAAIMLNWTSLTGGTDGIRGIPRVVIAGWELNSAPRFLPLAACCAAICFWISWKVGHSPYGRALKAMRENESAVLSVGKNVVAMKLSVFALAAALASVAGSLYAHYVTFVSAEGFTLDLTVYILAMVILGGTGNLWGSLLGAAILTALPELLKFLALAPDIADKARQMLYGVILILILRIRPQGLIPESSTLTKAQDPGFRPDVGALVKAAKLEGKGLE